LKTKSRIQHRHDNDKWNQNPKINKKSKTKKRKHCTTF
jgi:hypothetical protein